MRKTKKQLLGLAGLAAVIAMTAVAYSMPAPDAAAATPDNPGGYNCGNGVEGNECASAENGTQIQVVVSEGVVDAKFSSPQNGSTTMSPDVTVTSNYSDVVAIEYYVTYKDGDETVRDDLDTFVPTQASGVHTFMLNANKYGYRTISIHSVARGSQGTERTDVVTFDYVPITAAFQDKPAANGDPILSITSNDAVETLLIRVYDRAGNQLFVNEDDKEEPIEITRDMIDPQTGRVLQVLPFQEYHAKNGEYNAVITALGEDGEYLYMLTVPTTYKLIDPNVPEVPDSGIAGFLNALNITRLDYLLTGLLVFGLVSVFALFLVYRKSRR